MRTVFKMLLLSLVKGYREIFDKEYAKKLIFKKRKKELVNEIMLLSFDERLETIMFINQQVVKLTKEESLKSIMHSDMICQNEIDIIDRNKRRINLLNKKRHELDTIAS